MSQMTGKEQAFAPAPMLSRVASFFALMVRGVRVRRAERQLRLCESLSLGEKRFLAIVQCGKQHLLIGVTGESVSLLRQLDDDLAVASHTALQAQKPEGDRQW